jgi:acetylornithine deacetylase/succinyl-diaminopimelate desuccinylase-like protein
MDPWTGEIAEGRLYGRGAADMKAGIAAALHAVRGILHAGLRPAGDLWFHVVTDEEIVGYGTRECVATLPPTDRRSVQRSVSNPPPPRPAGAAAAVRAIAPL